MNCWLWKEIQVHKVLSLILYSIYLIKFELISVFHTILIITENVVHSFIYLTYVFWVSEPPKTASLFI